MGAGASAPMGSQQAPPPAPSSPLSKRGLHSPSATTYLDSDDLWESGWDTEGRILEVMNRDRTPPQMRKDAEGDAIRAALDAEYDQWQPQHIVRHRYYRGARARERTEKYMNSVKSKNIQQEEVDAQVRVQQRQEEWKDEIALKDCPRFPRLGVSLRVFTHFAAEIRRTRALHLDPELASEPYAGNIDGMLVCEVFDCLVRPLVEPYDIDNLTSLTEDLLEDFPTALSIEKDVGHATHFIVCNPEAKFIDLADALLLRFGEAEKVDDESMTRFFWLDCFCMPVDRAPRFPAKWWHDELRLGLRDIDNLVVVFLDCCSDKNESDGSTSGPKRIGGDGFSRGSKSEWRSGGIVEHIECLVPLALGLEECKGALEVLQDPDRRDAMQAALMQDFDGALASITERVHSISLSDISKRTRYFQAAGFYVSPQRRWQDAITRAQADAAALANTARIRESSFYFDHEYVRKAKESQEDLLISSGGNVPPPDRHRGIDLAVVSMLRGWILVEGMSLLKNNLSHLTVNSSKHVGSVNLEDLYPFVLAMAGHIETASSPSIGKTKARKRTEDVLRLVLDSATEKFGSLSRFALEAADRLCHHYHEDKKWDEAEPLLRQKLARLRQAAVDAKEREDAALSSSMDSQENIALDEDPSSVGDSAGFENPESLIPQLTSGITSASSVTSMLLLRNSRTESGEGSADSDISMSQKMAADRARKIRDSVAAASDKYAKTSYTEARERVREVCYTLGCILRDKDKDDEAQPLLTEALGCGAAEVLDVHLRRAKKVYLSARKGVPGSKEKALQMFGDIVKNCNGNTQEHSAVLQAADVVAMHLLRDQGDRGQAETLFRRICRARLKTSGEGAKDVMTGLAHRRVAMLMLEDYSRMQEAASFVHAAINADQPLSDNLPQVLIDNEVQGDTLRGIGAAVWAERVGDFFRAVHREDHRSAVKFYQSAIHHFDVVCPDPRKDPTYPGWGWEWSALEIQEACLSVVAKIAPVLQEFGKSKQAKRMYRRYLTSCRPISEKDKVEGNRRADELLQCQQDMAWIYTAEGNHSNAEPLFREAYVMMAKRWGGQHHLALRARAR